MGLVALHVHPEQAHVRRRQGNRGQDCVDGADRHIDHPLARLTIASSPITGDPDAMAAMGKRLADRGATYLDAAIAGSSAQVRTGEVLVLVGGDPAAIATCDDLFRAFADAGLTLGTGHFTG